MNIIKSNLKFLNLTERRFTDGIVLHHTEGSNYGSNPVKKIHEMHLNRGWSGIGYHFIVDKDGKIYEGRPLKMSGAQCKYHNYHTVGVSAVGNYCKDTMPEAQKESIAAVCRYIKSQYNIKKIYMHKDLNSTDCPGLNYPYEEIIKRIDSKPTAPQVNYCLEFQKWFNDVTDTKSPLVEDGICGSKTEWAKKLMFNELVK